MRFKLCGGFYFGTGLISVMGPSFTFLPIGQMMMQEATLDFSGTNGTGLEWYGKFLGTCAVAALVEVVISFVPPKYGCVPTHLTSHDLRLTHYLLCRPPPFASQDYQEDLPAPRLGHRRLLHRRGPHPDRLQVLGWRRLLNSLRLEPQQMHAQTCAEYFKSEINMVWLKSGFALWL